MTREEEIRNRYEKELENMRREQSTCNHKWEEIKYDPEIKQIPKYEDRFRGSDYMPELVGFTDKEIDRWSRTCKKCGKIEYTKELVPTQYKAKFD